MQRHKADGASSRPQAQRRIERNFASGERGRGPAGLSSNLPGYSGFRPDRCKHLRRGVAQCSAISRKTLSASCRALCSPALLRGERRIAGRHGGGGAWMRPKRPGFLQKAKLRPARCWIFRPSPWQTPILRGGGAKKPMFSCKTLKDVPKLRGFSQVFPERRIFR